MELGKSLKTMGIYELREFARQIGVVSPTTKKRAELISAIEAINNGEVKVSQKTKKGRPPKSVKSVASYYDMLIPEELKTKDELSDKFLSFRNVGDTETKQTNVNGYVRKTINNNYYVKNEDYISSFKLVYIPNKLLGNFETGDYVSGVCVGDENKDYAMLIKFDEGCTIDKVSNFENIIEKDKYIDLLNCKQGERILTFFDNPRGFYTEQEELSKKLINDGYKVVYISSNLPNEVGALAKFKVLGEHFESLYDESYETVYDRTSVAIDHVISLARQGENVVVMVYNILELLNSLDLYYGAQGKIFVKDHTIEAVQMVKRLFALGRNLDKGSVTVIATTNDLESEFIKNNLSVIATKIKA